MPHAVETVKGEGQGRGKLQSELGRQGPGAEGGRKTGALEMPAKERRDEIGGEEDIEASGENGAGDAIERTEVPCDLWSVDGEMGRYGAVETLSGEDLVIGTDSLRGDWSQMCMRIP